MAFGPFQETSKTAITLHLRKFFEPSQKPKVIYTDNSLEFGKSCEHLSWNHRTSTPHRFETNGIAESAVRRDKMRVPFASLMDICHLKNARPPGRRENTFERRFGEPLKGPIIPFGAMVEYHPMSTRNQSRLHQFGKKVLPSIFLGCEVIAVRIWKGDSDCGVKDIPSHPCFTARYPHISAPFRALALGL